MRIKKIRIGYCPICKKQTVFLSKEDWLRDHYLCMKCKSIPRQRALFYVLDKEMKGFEYKIIHESSPSGPTFQYMKKHCTNYSFSYYKNNIIPGTRFSNGSSCENLERLTLPDDSIDIMITQDVMEHINNPENAFREIARVLKKGGKHIFTVPLYKNIQSKRRIGFEGDKMIFLEPKSFHMNPIDKKGSLVTYDWGYDIKYYIKKWSGMNTKIYTFENVKKYSSLGLDAEFLQVLVSIKE